MLTVLLFSTSRGEWRLRDIVLVKGSRLLASSIPRGQIQIEDSRDQSDDHPSQSKLTTAIFRSQRDAKYGQVTQDRTDHGDQSESRSEQLGSGEEKKDSCKRLNATSRKSTKRLDSKMTEKLDGHRMARELGKSCSNEDRNDEQAGGPIGYCKVSREGRVG